MQIQYLAKDGSIKRIDVEVLQITSEGTPHIICFDKAPGVAQLVTSEEKVFPELLEKTEKLFKQEDTGCLV